MSYALMKRWFSSAPVPALKQLGKIADLRAWRKNEFLSNKTVGFVPTMGALHNGHLGLLKRSLEENDSTIVSIFVNPAQFSPTEDLDQYPRTLDADIAKIQSVMAKFPSKQVALFVPTVSEMYPSGVVLQVENQVGAFVSVQGLSEQLEGAVRPHFFRGVATVVCKLFHITTPTRAYFGQKDIQQSIVIKRMVKDLLMDVEIVVCPTAREEHSLAMSSRNEYLTKEGREKANILFKALSSSEQKYQQGVTDAAQLIADARKVLTDFSAENPDFPISIDYIAISDKETLSDVSEIIPGTGAILSAAIHVPNREGDQTRILDNIILY